MKNLRKHINAFLADEQGAETVEWVMVAAILCAIITAVFWGALQTALNAGIARISLLLTTAPAA